MNTEQSVTELAIYTLGVVTQARLVSEIFQEDTYGDSSTIHPWYIENCWIALRELLAVEDHTWLDSTDNMRDLVQAAFAVVASRPWAFPTE